MLNIPTEPIGRLPRPPELLDAIATTDGADPALDELYDFKIPFAARHVRRMLRLTGGPFRYQTYADSYLDVALQYAHRPVKQAVISPSALSLMYPSEPIAGYSREQFIGDLLREHEAEVRNCLRKRAHRVQVDFTERSATGSSRLRNTFRSRSSAPATIAASRHSATTRRRVGETAFAKTRARVVGTALASQRLQAD